MTLITQDLIDQLMLKTLQIKLYGMTESKKKEHKKSESVVNNQNDHSISAASSSTAPRSGSGQSGSIEDD